jgi:hypothetical protein
MPFRYILYFTNNELYKGYGLQFKKFLNEKLTIPEIREIFIDLDIIMENGAYYYREYKIDKDYNLYQFPFYNSKQPIIDALVIRDITRPQEKQVYEYLEKNRHLYLILLSTIQDWFLQLLYV